MMRIKSPDAAMKFFLIQVRLTVWLLVEKKAFIIAEHCFVL